MRTVKRGRLIYPGDANETRLVKCPCEPIDGDPMNNLVAISNGNPDDLAGATAYLRPQFPPGTCVEISGIYALIGDINVFYLNAPGDPAIHVRPCPLGPCL